jgi:hypothetical protein
VEVGFFAAGVFTVFAVDRGDLAGTDAPAVRVVRVVFFAIAIEVYHTQKTRPGLRDRRQRP